MEFSSCIALPGVNLYVTVVETVGESGEQSKSSSWQSPTEYRVASRMKE